MVDYSLFGDRKVEYRFAKEHISEGNGWVLDIGPGPYAKLADYTCNQGWNVIGVDLGKCNRHRSRFTFIRADFTTLDIDRKFDLVLNVSSMEHFGIAGRYGVIKMDSIADLRAMRKARELMKSEGYMILTVPVGMEAVFAPYHRVYGYKSLASLLSGFRILEQQYWAKRDGIDEYVEVSREEALSTRPLSVPHRYYAIGGFILNV